MFKKVCKKVGARIVIIWGAISFFTQPFLGELGAKLTDKVTSSEIYINLTDSSKGYEPKLNRITQEEFDLYNKYIVYAGAFMDSNSFNKRLEQVRLKYRHAEKIEYKTRYNTKKFFRVKLEEGKSISSSEILDWYSQYHNELIYVIDDELGPEEKIASPEMTNKYFEDEIVNVSNYAQRKQYGKSIKGIESIVDAIEKNTIFLQRINYQR